MANKKHTKTTDASRETAAAENEAAPAGDFPRAAAPLSIDFEGHGIKFYTFRGRVCVITGEYGRAMGYAGDGKGLTEQVTGEWSKEFLLDQDFSVLTGDDLREFKVIAALRGGNPLSRAPHLQVLYESGFDLAALLTRQPLGRQLRRMVVELVLPKLRRGEPVLPSSRVALPGQDEVVSLRAENSILRAEIELFRDPASNGTIGKARANTWIRGLLREAARTFCAAINDFTEAAFRRELNDRENQLRLHVGFPRSKAQGWENLEILKYGSAIGKVFEMLERDRARAKRERGEPQGNGQLPLLAT